MKYLPSIVMLTMFLGCGAPAEQSRKPSAEEAFDTQLTIALAETMIEAKAHQNAVQMLRKARHRNPEDPRIIYLLATVLRDRGAYDQAEREFFAALKLDAKLAPAHGGLALTYDLMSRYAQAEVHHQKAIELSPKTPRFHNNYGFSLYLAGRFKDAKRAYEEAIRLDPSSPTPYVNLGFALARMGQEEPAMRAFRQVISEAESFNNLALAYELNGERGRAKAFYQKSIALEPELEEAKANLRALENGFGEKQMEVQK